MPGETILIVEDAPDSLKFAASALRSEGYKVHIASTAEQALSTLRFLQPQLMLVDFLLPGMNGLELVSRVKQDARLQDTIVVALTACTQPEDEARARQAGCDGYLTKPIDAHSLITRVRDFLRPRGLSAVQPSGSAAQAAPAISIPEDELAELQASFLKAGKGVSRQLLFSLDGQFDADKAQRTVHQWIGTAGLLNYPNIAYRARDVETVLRTPPWTAGQLRPALTQLARVFQNPGATAAPPSAATVRALDGKRIALIGLGGDAADHMCSALEQVGARARLFEGDETPYTEAVGFCHLAVVHVRPENRACRWLDPEAPGLPTLPTVYLGALDDLLALSTQVQARACSLLMAGTGAEETLMRLRLALLPASPAPQGPADSAGGLVIADADEAYRQALEGLLPEFGYSARFASSGPDTILLLHQAQPKVAVVDVQLDGFEALAAIRAESLAVRTIFVTAQAQEDEILRGFSLGAEDYVARPFSPLELVARVKRLM